MRSATSPPSAGPAPGTKEILGDHGHARAAFCRAIERGNLIVAEIEARDAGPLDLGEALELTALIALRDRPRSSRFAVRWLQRWFEESAPTIEDAAMVAGCLAALGGSGHDAALAALRTVSTDFSTGKGALASAASAFGESAAGMGLSESACLPPGLACWGAARSGGAGRPGSALAAIA